MAERCRRQFQRMGPVMSFSARRHLLLLPLLLVPALGVFAQGPTPSQTDIFVSTPVAGAPASIIGTVRPATAATLPLATPTGTVTLFEGSTAVAPPVALTPESAFLALPFAALYGTPDPIVATNAIDAVWGDFNEDGVPDLLVYGQWPTALSLRVQTFLSAKLPALPPGQPLPPQELSVPLNTFGGHVLAVLDVDGDGHLDLLGDTMVAYGNGDGTFGRVAELPALAAGYLQTYAVDIDGDGKVDIVAVNKPPGAGYTGPVQYSFTVFHNNGGGSFTPLGPYALAPSFIAGSYLYNVFGLSFADINGDGRVDVLSQSNMLFSGTDEAPNHLNVMLNLGTGFAAPQQINIDALQTLGPLSVSVVDINGDGKLDLALSGSVYTRNNEVATLLGAGDGTFAAPSVYPIGISLTIGNGRLPLAVEDFNLDGKPDVVLGTGLLYLGNGDGTLTAGPPLFTSVVPILTAPPVYPVLTVPPEVLTNSAIPSVPSLLFVNLQAGANAVYTPRDGATAAQTPVLPAGQHTVTMHYSGDSTYAASISPSATLTVAPPLSVGASGDTPTTLTVAAGQSVTTQLSLTGGGGFSGMATLSCRGLPAEAACTFSPASVSIASNAAVTSMLTISTSSSAAASVRYADALHGLTTLACGFSLFGLLALAPLRRRRLLLSLCVTLVVSVAGLTGCGDSSQTTPAAQARTAPGSYTFSVVATSGANTATANYTLQVQ